MKILIQIALFFAFFSYSTVRMDAQIINKSAQVLVKGKITDFYSGNPMQVEIRFEDPSGKFFKISSNSLTGNFEQILQTDVEYNVRLNSNSIFPTSYILKTPKADKYIEINQDYQAIKLEKQSTALALDLFQSGSDKINANTSDLIKDLNLKMRFNRSVKIEFEINVSDSRNQFEKEITKKVKKKTITEKSFDKIAFESLAESRFQQAISTIKSQFTFPDRITITKNISEKIEDKLLSTCPECDVRIIIIEFDQNIK